MPTLLPTTLHWHLQHHPTLSSTMDVLDSTQLGEDEAQLIWCDEQTAGRGQRGTHWESAAGANLLFSFAFRPPALEATQQFLLSQVASLALIEVLSPLIEGVSIKWPNDIYHHNHKICGMLLYHQLAGTRISHTLVGIGLNVNQKAFHSSAPNPISLWQITGSEHDREQLLQAFLNAFERWGRSEAAHIAQSYHAQLYHREGLHPYQDTLSGECFQARLHHISPDGPITLCDERGQLRTFAFKEVRYL